jgi:hypothetical protein
MNLEEELATLESTSSFMTQVNNNITDSINQTVQPVNEVNQVTQMNNVNQIPTNNFNNITQAPYQMEANVSQPQYQQPIQNQPAMVDTNMAAQQAAEFNFKNFDFDINKPQREESALPRLAGQKDESFRLHILPVPPKKIHTHWDEERNRNFVCLEDIYGEASGCCTTHGKAKPRNIVPVLVYPTVQGNINALVPNATPELKVLVINDKKFNEIFDAAASVLGVDIDNVNLDNIDIIARVDNVQFKSHIFNCTPTTMKAQVQNYKPQLVERWKAISTPENICKAAATLITKEVYNSTYSNYNYKNYVKDYSSNNKSTPTQGAVPGAYSFTTPMNQGNAQQPFGGFNQQPFYNGQQSNTGFNQYNQNPWQ